MSVVLEAENLNFFYFVLDISDPRYCSVLCISSQHVSGETPQFFFKKIWCFFKSVGKYGGAWTRMHFKSFPAFSGACSDSECALSSVRWGMNALLLGFALHSIYMCIGLFSSCNPNELTDIS